MSAGSINRELDRLEWLRDRLLNRAIEAGRGFETFSETRVKAEAGDPLALELVTVSDRARDLRLEIEARYGPNPPRRLPIRRGWYGPRVSP